MSDGMASGGRDAGAVTCAPFVLGEEPGAIVAGFGVHQRQITVDALDTATGEVIRGQIESTPAAVQEWVARCSGRVIHVAVEACTAGCLCAGRSSAAARSRTSPSRWRRAPCGVASAGPRPTAPMRGGCVSCCARADCPRRGCRLSTFASGARARGCVTRWSMTAPAVRRSSGALAMPW